MHQVLKGLILVTIFVDRYLSFVLWPFVFRPSSIYGFWLPLSYFLTLLTYQKSGYLLSCIGDPSQGWLPRLDTVVFFIPNISILFIYNLLTLECTLWRLLQKRLYVVRSWCDCSFCWYPMNYWPSQVTFSFLFTTHLKSLNTKKNIEHT